MTTGLHDVGTKLLDRLSLLGSEGSRGIPLIFSSQALKLGLGVLELCLQLVLFGAVPSLSLGLDPINHVKRASRGAARTQPDEIVTAGQHLNRIGDKITVVCGRNEDPLTKELLLLQPELVVEHIAIGNYDHIDRPQGLLEKLALWRLWRLISLALLCLGLGGLGQFRRPVRKGALCRPGNVRGKNVALVVGF